MDVNADVSGVAAKEQKEDNKTNAFKDMAWTVVWVLIFTVIFGLASRYFLSRLALMIIMPGFKLYKG
ncbi:hypothetical protein [Butyrivibrio sp. AC2005]|uniref:hypothetical protein n=1 Tax=Butyrivibrio sp. AC2005 TaxID=1280672 RepID=UPI0003F9C2B1|nr:hypothetical protein [Butyrivibrio sp. AC2005]